MGIVLDRLLKDLECAGRRSRLPRWRIHRRIKESRDGTLTVLRWLATPCMRSYWVPLPGDHSWITLSPDLVSVRRMFAAGSAKNTDIVREIPFTRKNFPCRQNQSKPNTLLSSKSR